MIIHASQAHASLGCSLEYIQLLWNGVGEVGGYSQLTFMRYIQHAANRQTGKHHCTCNTRRCISMQSLRSSIRWHGKHTMCLFHVDVQTSADCSDRVDEMRLLGSRTMTSDLVHGFWRHLMQWWSIGYTFYGFMSCGYGSCPLPTGIYCVHIWLDIWSPCTALNWEVVVYRYETMHAKVVSCISAISTRHMMLYFWISNSDRHIWADETGLFPAYS